MNTPILPYIVIEPINLDRLDDFYSALVESGKEWFSAGVIPNPDLSKDELEHMIRAFLTLRDQDNAYVFYILDEKNDQVVGIALLNQIYRTHQMGNLAYVVRTSRTGEGIATEAARLVAQYGFEKLGLQRIELVASPDNAPSLRVAEKLGASREALLRNRLLLHDVPCSAYLYSLIPFDFGINKTVA